MENGGQQAGACERNSQVLHLCQMVPVIICTELLHITVLLNKSWQAAGCCMQTTPSTVIS
jgi:hypothetical protein